MAQSKAATVAAYLAELPEERRTVVAAVRDEVVRHLPAGYREAMRFGMISYEVPLERYPDTYNGQPLSYMALAAQKNHCALYLMCVYGDPAREAWLRDEFAKAGKKLDLGKSCLRFKKLDDLPAGVVAKVTSALTPEGFIALYEASRKK